MDIIVKGRHTDVSDRFKRHVDTKLAKIERLNQKVIRVDVEISQEHNPRQSYQRERVELTIHSRGPAIRAEAAADDRYGALDLAFEKLESRLRRISERRKAHGAPRERVSSRLLAEPTLGLDANGNAGHLAEGGAASSRTAVAEIDTDEYAPKPDVDDHIVPIPMDGECPVVVREKFHKAEPMDIEQALLEMELVGHDFFLFRDVACGKASVVYRRRGWDYGVIRLVEE